ncbi:uncharacterized protein LOC128989120 isoform X3 [Macrosteles quadrilineatus]|nr:uncharacterized protein LOC128989120 isoform X3 [Macrosteles quadrilineatus]
MKGLKEAVKQQEIQLSKNIAINANEGDGHIKSIPHTIGKELDNNLTERFPSNLEHLLHKVESDTSQLSHWSWSIGSINSSVDDLKFVLKNQDQQVITLIRENEDLRNELKNKNKEIKKQKFLLRAEREAFEQYKKDTLNVIKKQDNLNEEEDIQPEKSSKELMKLKSELAHYSQMYIEQRHTMSRLSKIITTLRDDSSRLKDKLVQQEKQYNKFILEMAQRFKVSRTEFQVVVSKLQTSPIPPTNLAVCKIADRNARLAYDNCMLKLELNGLKEKYFHQKADKNKLKCLATRSDFCHYKQEKEKGKLENYQESDLNYANQLKSSRSELSGLTNNIKLNLKCAVKTSVTSLIERNSGNIPKCQQVSNNLDRSSESFEVMRTESAPLLRTSYKDM